MNVGDTVEATKRAAGRPRRVGRAKQLLFGPAHQIGATTVIPVAESRVGFGVGGGDGGLGGVAALRVEPVGFITVRGERADFTPIRDYTRLILLGIACATCVAVVLSVLLSFARRHGRRAGESPETRRG